MDRPSQRLTLRMGSVPSVRFPPLGISTSRIGLGCASLIGRHTFKAAARLVETALDLGIRYFDTAPLYGMGTAEEVLGAIVGESRDVIIATKVGIARPHYSPFKASLRRLAQPVFNRSRPLKAWARALYMHSAHAASTAASQQTLRDLADGTVRRELETSLQLLRRSRVDVYLAHDPLPENLGPPTEAVFQALLDARLIGCFGAAITGPSGPWHSFGTVWQSRWSSPPMQTDSMGTTCIFHGVIRNAAKDRFGRTHVAPAALLRLAMQQAPDALFLIAASTPDALRRLTEEVIV